MGRMFSIVFLPAIICPIEHCLMVISLCLQQKHNVDPFVLPAYVDQHFRIRALDGTVLVVSDINN